MQSAVCNYNRSVEAEACLRKTKHRTAMLCLLQHSVLQIRSILHLLLVHRGKHKQNVDPAKDPPDDRGNKRQGHIHGLFSAIKPYSSDIGKVSYEKNGKCCLGPACDVRRLMRGGGCPLVYTRSPFSPLTTCTQWRGFAHKELPLPYFVTPASLVGTPYHSEHIPRPLTRAPIRQRAP